MAEIPMIVSVDDHVVEPPHLWQTWLPEQLPGPRAPRRAPRHRRACSTSAAAPTSTSFDRRRPARPTAGSTRTSSTSTSATSPRSGFDRDDMTMSPITYDEMRPGCYEPKARRRRHGHEPRRGVALASRPSRASAARPSSRPRTATSRMACVLRLQRLDGRGVVRRQRRRASSRSCIIPLWDAELAAAEVRRNAARGVHAVCFSEIPPHLGLPSIHTGYWDPFFAACAGDRDRRLHAHRLVVADAGDVGRRARSPSPPRCSFGNAMASLTRLPVLRRARAVPRR